MEQWLKLIRLPYSTANMPQHITLSSSLLSCKKNWRKPRYDNKKQYLKLKVLLVSVR